MKTFYIGLGIVIVIGLLIGIWFLISPKAPQQVNTVPGSSLPIASSTNLTGENTTIPNQPGSAGTQPEIAKTFLSQIQNSNLITLKGTTVISDYALQTWGDVNKGGEALLQYNSSKGWTLISMGGGAWDVSSLIQVGVPQLIAEQLVAGSK